MKKHDYKGKGILEIVVEIFIIIILFGGLIASFILVLKITATNRSAVVTPNIVVRSPLQT